MEYTPYAHPWVPNLSHIMLAYGPEEREEGEEKPAWPPKVAGKHCQCPREKVRAHSKVESELIHTTLAIP